MLKLKESLELLKKYGIPVVETLVASNEEEVLKAAEKIGYPVVVKPNVSEHKSEIGVFLDVKSDEELLKCYKNLGGEVVVQKMIRGFEIFLGAKEDKFFGKYVALGCGGVLVELFEDVSFRVLPLRRRDVLEMVEETKLSKVARGFRSYKLDVESLVEVVLRFSELIEKENVKEADVNPLIANENGVFAVDARIIL
ncbi:acetate--CoA ligase family protein [Ferroglobus placidus]|nr:acetate--CoA ligase family protein [Ferroglobus placidus]